MKMLAIVFYNPRRFDCFCLSHVSAPLSAKILQGSKYAAYLATMHNDQTLSRLNYYTDNRNHDCLFYAPCTIFPPSARPVPLLPASFPRRLSLFPNCLLYNFLIRTARPASTRRAKRVFVLVRVNRPKRQARRASSINYHATPSTKSGISIVANIFSCAAL